MTVSRSSTCSETQPYTPLFWKRPTEHALFHKGKSSCICALFNMFMIRTGILSEVRVVRRRSGGTLNAGGKGPFPRYQRGGSGRPLMSGARCRDGNALIVRACPRDTSAFMVISCVQPNSCPLVRHGTSATSADASPPVQRDWER